MSNNILQKLHNLSSPTRNHVRSWMLWPVHDASTPTAKMEAETGNQPQPEHTGCAVGGFHSQVFIGVCICGGNALQSCKFNLFSLGKHGSWLLTDESVIKVSVWRKSVPWKL